MTMAYGLGQPKKSMRLLSPLGTAIGHLPWAIVYASKSFNLVIVSIVFTSPSIGL